MFGFFKRNKISAVEDQFVTDLALFSSDFKYGVPSVDDNTDKTISTRALDSYLEKLQEESEYSASDFYMNSFTGAIFELINGGRLSMPDSMNLFREVSSFLDCNPKYNSNVTKVLIEHWGNLITNAGGNPLFI